MSEEAEGLCKLFSFDIAIAGGLSDTDQKRKTEKEEEYYPESDERVVY